MKSLLLPVIALLAFSLNSRAQCTDSLFGAGGPAPDFACSAVMDTAQNLYTTGSYDSSATFEDTTILGNSLRYGIFIAKYNARREFQWVKRFARAKRGFPQPPVIARSGRHLYVFARALNDSISINGVTYTSPGQPGSRTYFLVHLDSIGGIAWTRVYRYRDNLSASNGFDMAAELDTSGNVYISGSFTDTLRLGNIRLGTPGNVAPSVFIAKINSGGTVLWARASTSNSTAYGYGGHMHVSPKGKVIVGGHYHSSITFGTSTSGSTPASPVAGAPFLVAYDTAGVFSWLNTTTVTTARLSNSTTSTSDRAGNTYSSGFIYDTVDFGGGSKLIGTNDMYLAKYSDAGTLLWATRKQGHVGLSGTESGTGMIVNNAGRLIVTGVFTDSTYFGSTRYLSAGGQDFFIGEYDSTGSLLRVNTYGSTGMDEADCPIVHPNDSLVISGVFTGASLNMNGRTLLSRGSGSTDMFWYDRCAKIESVIGVGISGHVVRDLRVYPNPTHAELTIDFGETSIGQAILSIYDIAGRKISVQSYPAGLRTAHVSSSNWSAGTYLVSLRMNGKTYRKLVVKE